MAADAEVVVKGWAELAAGTRTLAGNIEEAAPRAFEGVAGQVANTVRATVPRRTGALAGSVTTTPVQGGAGVSMGAGVRYAGYVEYGGRGHPHSSQGNYLYPAAMDAEPQLAAAGADVAQSEIGAMHWPSPS